MKENAGVLAEKDQTVKELDEKLRKVYLDKVGVEFSHFQNSYSANEQLYSQFE